MSSRDPEQIRVEIDETRERMSETAGAIGYKANVPARARESVANKAGAVRDKIAGAGTRINEATPSGGDAAQGAKRAVGMAQENPVGLAIGSIAAGFLLGLVLPHTRMEDERLGPVADNLKQEAMSVGQEALQHGKEVAQETAQTAAQTVKEQAGEHGQQLAESARESAQAATPNS